jgi:PIN domain nuclease of toxin-antitoxin system
MRYLLDSHTFLWLAFDDPALSAAARSIAVDRGSRLYLSVVTIWELAIKINKGKLTFPQPLQRLVEDGMYEFKLEILPVTAEDAHYTIHLPNHHDDPFDRMLIAQANVRGLKLITKDSRLAAYDVPLIW